MFVIEGEKNIFSCDASAYPVPDYTVRYKLNVTTSSSRPIKLLRNDNGSIISCSASNFLGSAQCETVLIVTYKPDQPGILFSPNKSIVDEGKSVNMTCKAEAYPKPYYLWIFKGEMLRSEINDTVILSNITVKDAGNYTCIAVNYLGKSLVVIDLTLDYFREPTCEAVPVKVQEGAIITLKCSVDAYPSASYTWKIGQRIIRRTSTVTVTASRELHKKAFTCIAENSRESKNCTTSPLDVFYLDVEVNGSSNKSYCQSNPLVLFNLSVNSYPSNASLTCNPSVLTVITSHDAGLHTKQYLVLVIIQKAVDSASIICKAGNNVDEREKTLHFYRQPMHIKEKFGGQFVITSQEWQDELKDSKAERYKNLENKCIKTLEKAYNGIPYLTGVNIKEFLKGSIKVRFELEVIGKVSDPLLPLRDYIKRQGGEIDGLQIDHDSIQKSSDLQDNLPTATAEENKTTVTVFGVLFALSIVLNIIFIALFLWLRRKDSKRHFGKRSNKGDDIGQMNDISLQETSLSATENNNPNMQEYEPIRRRGLAASNVGIPEYEAVTTQTQKAQTQSGVQSKYPMPQYERADQHRLPGADANPPSATYQTIQPRTGDYGSLNPSTRLPPKGIVSVSTGSPTRTGEYRTLQHKGVSPQYQSLDDLSRC